MCLLDTVCKTYVQNIILYTSVTVLEISFRQPALIPFKYAVLPFDIWMYFWSENLFK